MTERFFEHFPDSSLPAKYRIRITHNGGFQGFVNRKKVADTKIQIDALVAVEAWMRENCAYKLGNFVHAACALVGKGAIMLPGETHAGKSTVVGSMVKHGAKYCSDELAEITPTGVGTYPKPLYLRPPGAKGDSRKVVFLRKEEVAPDLKHPVSVIAFPKKGPRDRLLTMPRPEALGKLATRLLCKTLSYQQLELLKGTILSARTYTLEWCDPAKAAALVIDAGDG